MRLLSAIATWLVATSAWAQAMYFDSSTVPAADADSIGAYQSLADSLIAEGYAPDTLMSLAPLPKQMFMPPVFRSYELDQHDPLTPDYSGDPNMRWVEDAISGQRRMQNFQQRMMVGAPWLVKYNYDNLPEPPKEYVAIINPEDHTITIDEISGVPEDPLIETTEVKKKHWLKTFNASLQFSQAYISPNWYQGGNNNLNALLDLYYNVKLNQTFHPKLLFETTFQYKLGVNNAPDDTLRTYNISTDVFQINSVFGYKAANNWYYSVTGQFKTQLLNAYPTNSNELKSAFLSPGELNIGLGMTYNYTNPPKTVQVDVSINPLSYNLAICTNNRLDPTAYGVDAGHHYKSTFGSNLECKLAWKISETISFSSRLFGFTDYDRAYADWENTLVFQLTKFMTTQVYANFRYDTDTPPVTDEKKWKKLQVKEILSIGFAYKFSTM
ncbi:MAG: DUF3078 domain-containing protein [Bacteroidales bacterium]|nr:DUF3078 domain-containing protein [Bacteroidales bacterium]